ncbi:MAG: rane protein involved in aromatic hydrocarbon degradation [Labilithrix sp.]|nr:rane protein involved in aromatic hydrocarbon degradation [Labilithrix sp.]
MKTRILGITGVATLGAFFSLSTVGASDAHAAGTALDIQGARATGMASTTTAWIDDSSAIFFNPAGIAQGKKLMVEAGVNIVIPSFSITPSNGGAKASTEGIVTPFQVYASGGITENLSVGVGVFTPFGLDVKWPAGWAGRSLITESSLRTYYINPTAAYRIGPVRIGAGLQIARGTLELQKDLNFGNDTYGHADLGGGAWGVGYNVGVQVEAIKQYLNFGAHYRSAVKLDFDEAKAHFSNVPQSFQAELHDQPVMGSVTQPDSLAMGVSSRVLKDLNLAVDVVWMGHSKLRSVDLNYPEDASGSLNSSQPKHWHDTVNFHIGAEGNIGKHWQARGGVLIDPSPSPDNTLTPDIPDSTRVNLAAGGTYRTDFGLHVDLGYQFIALTGKTSTVPQLPGDYGGFVNIIGITVGYTTPDKKKDDEPPPPSDIPPPPADPNPPVVAPAPADPNAPAPAPAY